VGRTGNNNDVAALACDRLGMLQVGFQVWNRKVIFAVNPGRVMFYKWMECTRLGVLIFPQATLRGDRPEP
jgi:hypothetical protein